MASKSLISGAVGTRLSNEIKDEREELYVRERGGVR